MGLVHCTVLETATIAAVRLLSLSATAVSNARNGRLSVVSDSYEWEETVAAIEAQTRLH